MWEYFCFFHHPLKQGLNRHCCILPHSAIFCAHCYFTLFSFKRLSCSSAFICSFNMEFTEFSWEYFYVVEMSNQKRRKLLHQFKRSIQVWVCKKKFNWCLHVRNKVWWGAIIIPTLSLFMIWFRVSRVITGTLLILTIMHLKVYRKFGYRVIKIVYKWFQSFLFLLCFSKYNHFTPMNNTPLGLLQCLCFLGHRLAAFISSGVCWNALCSPLTMHWSVENK